MARPISPAARPSAPVEATKVTNIRVQRHHSFSVYFGYQLFEASSILPSACYFSMLFPEYADALDKSACLLKFSHDLRLFSSKNFISHFVSEFR